MLHSSSRSISSRSFHKASSWLLSRGTRLHRHSPPPFKRPCSRFSHSSVRRDGNADEFGSYTEVLLRPLLFTATIGLTSFGAASIYDYEEETQEKREFWTPPDLHSNLEPLAETHGAWKVKVLLAFHNVWRRLALLLMDDPRADTVGPIIAMNVFLHALFCLPGFNLVKRTYFVHHPGSGKALPMLLSNFAHGGIFHLGLNSYGLWSFGDYTKDLLPTPQQFWAFYVTSGTFASLGHSVASMALYRIQGTVPLAVLGSSGAVYAVAFAAGLTAPDLYIGLIGLPKETYLSAKSALTVLATFDYLALVLNLPTRLGHAAHLAGGLAGYKAVNGGLSHVEAYQRKVVQYYKQLKDQWGE